MEKEILNRLKTIENQLYATKDVLTFVEAANYTGLSRSHLYKLTYERKIPHYKPRGKMIYFDRKELNDWLLQNPITTANEIEKQAVDYCYNTNRKGGLK